MPKRLLWSLLAVSICVPAAAEEMLVFKQDSPYKGSAMKVASYQRKGSQLIITGVRGDLFAAPEAAIDWERSRLATEALRALESSESSRRAEEEQAQRNAAIQHERAELGLVEASRRYGVDKPAVSTASGSAVRDVETPMADKGTVAPPPGGGQAPLNAVEGTEVKAARDRLAAAKAEHDKLAKDIETLRADTNTDPLSSAQRESRLRDKQTTLAEVLQKVKSREESLNRAIADAAKKAEKAAPAAAPAKTPAPTTK